MDKVIKEQYIEYLKKSENHPVRESWVKKNLTDLYDYLEDKGGNTLSEKLYLIHNEKGKCRTCGSSVKFLSLKRGYRDFCSSKCTNNNKDLIKKKFIKYKNTSNDKYGFDNPAKSYKVREKIKQSRANIDYEKVNDKFKKTSLKNWGVDNPSKSNIIKNKKKETSLKNWGVDNPFKSEDIKNVIKEIHINNLGVNHPMKSDVVLNRQKNTNVEKWGVDNYTKTKMYKELMFEKYRSGTIKTNLNIAENYIEYTGLGKHRMKCDSGKEHVFITNSHLYHSRLKLNNKQCTICYPVSDSVSIKELELYNFIKSIYGGKIIQSYRDSLEIDIYLPDLNIGFEFNGLYWHSEIFKDRDYHLNKTNYFRDKGIRIIHIWEDDWDLRSEILKSQIKNWLGLSTNKIYARKCTIKEIENVDEYRDFLNKNHIQGYVSSSLKIGLYYNDRLVSIMTFDHFEGRRKMVDGEWNLSRFCNMLDTNVIGGASKLLKYFISNYKPTRIISFADKSWSCGKLYNSLGFSVKKVSYPNYSYLINKERSNKQKWKKSKLIKLGYDSNLSESKIMEDNFGAYKIFDCGQIKFEKIIK